MKSILLMLSLGGIAFLGLSGCASALPFVPVATDVNTTVEGLVRVENSRFDAVYIRPGLDLADFDAVILAPVSISYKSSRTDSALSDRRLDLMKRYFSEELEGAFIESNKYRLVGAAGANTMRVRARIADLEINLPTELQGIRRNTVFFASPG